MKPCLTCGRSAVLGKHGFTRAGQQRYRCRACGRTQCAQPAGNAYSEARRDAILRAYQERTSLRGLTRIFGVSRQTVTAWLKKSAGPAPAGLDAGPARKGG